MRFSTIILALAGASIATPIAGDSASTDVAARTDAPLDSPLKILTNDERDIEAAFNETELTAGAAEQIGHLVWYTGPDEDQDYFSHQLTFNNYYNFVQNGAHRPPIP